MNNLIAGWVCSDGEDWEGHVWPHYGCHWTSGSTRTCLCHSYELWGEYNVHVCEKKYNIIVTNLSNNTACTSYKAMQNYIHDDIVLVEFCVLSIKIFNITQGVLSLKNTYFEPRYILTLPLTPQVCRYIYMRLFAVHVHCRLIHVDTCMYNVQLADSYVISWKCIKY